MDTPCLLFIKTGSRNIPVVCHQGWWHELYRDKSDNRPFLGPFRSEIHASDQVYQLTDEPAEETNVPGELDDNEDDTPDEEANL
jgi:hypothetical protein